MNTDDKKREEYTLRRIGQPFTTDYRIYFERSKDGVPVSPFHDIPLWHDEERGVLNMVVEIERWGLGKFEVCFFSLIPLYRYLACLAVYCSLLLYLPHVSIWMLLYLLSIPIPSSHLL